MTYGQKELTGKVRAGEKAFLAQMEEYLERNELQAVLHLARERLRQSPGDLEARIVICRVWLLQGRLDEAREMLDEMEEIIASLSQVYACMGDICMKKGMEDSAEEFYGRFRVLNPGAPLARDILERLEGDRRASTKRTRKGKRKRTPGFPPTSRR